MVKKKNIYNILIFLGTMFLIFTRFLSNRLFFQDMFAFEMVYLICTTVFFIIPNKSFDLPCIIFRITGFIRFVLLPILVYEKEDVRYFYESKVQIVMIMEMLIVHMVILSYYQSKVYRRKNQDNKRKNEEENFDIIPMRLGLTTMVIVAIGTLIFLRNPILLKNYLIFSFSEKSVSALDGSSAILFQISVFFAFIYLLSIIKKNSFFPDYVKILISFLVIIIYANGKGATAENVSRWGILVSLITGIVFVFCLYPKAKKTISLLTILIVPLVILASTFLKQEMWGNTTGGVESVLSVNSINCYFSGSLNVEKGIDLLDKEDINRTKTIFVDTFANFPMLNHFVDISETTATHFNKVFYGSSIARDQICPMIIQFIEYIGVFGFITYGIIAFLSLHFYTISKTKNTLLEKNIFIILTFYFSLMFCINWSILLEVIWIQILPLVLVNRFNIRVKKGGVRGE